MENTTNTIDNAKVNAVLKEFLHSFEYLKRNNDSIFALKDTASEDVRELTFNIISEADLCIDHGYRMLEDVISSFHNHFPENEASEFDIEKATEIDSPIYTADLLSFLVMGTVDEIEEAMKESGTESICEGIMYWYQEKARDMAYSAFEGIKTIAATRAQQ